MVEEDEKETGERKSLNVGHTTGHALELASGLSHGESVLWGMLLETRLAMKYGVCERKYGEELTALVNKALDVPPVGKIDFSNIRSDAEKARADKKNAEGGGICRAGAAAKGKWALFSLPFEKYREELAEAAREAERERGGYANEKN